MGLGSRLNAWACAVVFLFVMAGCGTTIDHVEIDRIKPEGDANSNLPEHQKRKTLVGVSEVDITPPIGTPSAGYSTMDSITTGMRHRLKARAFYMKDSHGQAMMLIQADLHAGSLLLHHAVAAEIQQETGIQPQGLMIAGTHSHGGPGNFFSSDFYNGWAGAEAGFDAALFDFLVAQLTKASLEAYNSRQPGRISVATDQVYGLTRNRAFAAYLRNPGVGATSRSQATNPLLAVVRLDAYHEGQLLPLGALASFSIHGTALPPSELIHGDVFHYTATMLPERLLDEQSLPWRPVFGLINGSHGDNSPDYSQQTFAEAKRIGQQLGNHFYRVFREAAPTGKPYREARLKTGAKELDLVADRQQPDSILCEPAVGTALVAGAEDGQNPWLYSMPLFASGWGEENPSASDCQGAKRKLGWFMQNWIIPIEQFPRHILLQSLQINDLTLLTMPFEVTYQMGEQFKRVVDNNDHQTIAVISCANGYAGYLTTAEEYAEQDYEGGHNLFGPRTGEYMLAQWGQLAVDLMENSSVGQFSSRWHYSLRHRVADDEIPIQLERQEFQRHVVEQPRWIDRSDEPDATAAEKLVRFRWRDAMPMQLALHQPLVRVESRAQGWQTVVDDQSDRLEIRLIGEDGEAAVYQVSWYKDEEQQKQLAGKALRFTILDHNQEPSLHSAPFDGRISLAH